MNKNVIYTAVGISLFTTTAIAGSHGGESDEMMQRKQQSVAVVKQFAGELKGHLQTAMKNGGPQEAIAVCNKIAPTVAARLSQENGWDVGRTSLKFRNPANAPDAWETKVLEKFDAEVAAGKSADTLAHAEMVTENGKQYFRFMKAIPTAAKPCLACHGANIKPEIAAELDKLYPEDIARGYKEGDIRGAFTIKQPM